MQGDTNNREKTTEQSTQDHPSLATGLNHHDNIYPVPQNNHSYNDSPMEEAAKR